MAVTAGSSDAVLSGAVGGSGPDSPLATATEGLTRGMWDGFDFPAFPPTPGTGEEVGLEIPIHPSYPIIPQRANNRITFRTDDKTWKVTQKSENLWGHEFITLQFTVVNAKYLKTLIQFLKDNAGKTVLFSHQGYTPFMTALEETNVIIKNYSSPQRIKPKTYVMSVTILKDPNI